MTKNGVALKTHPLHKVVMQKLAAVNAIGSQFGWSPVTRIRLRTLATPDEKKNDFTDFTE
jgi:phage terminase small subunit